MADNGGGGGVVGGKIAQRISRMVADAHLATKTGSADVNRRIANMVWRDFFAGTGAELRTTMGATFKALAEHPDTADSMRPLFAFLTRGQGEMATFIGGSITGSVISGGLGDLITNALAPAIHEIISREPMAELNVTDVAAAQTRHIPIGRSYADEAARAGYNSDRYGALVELNYRRPDVGQIWEQVNRGEISEQAGRAALLQLGFREADLDALMALRRVVIDPARLADLVTFGVLTEEQAAPMANHGGMSTQDFHLLVLGNGTPPSNEELAFALRRGVIDRDRYIRGLTQGSLRNEWIPYVEQMVLSPMSVADAIEAAVQNALTVDEARTITRQNGLIPEHFDPLLAINGSPPGPQEMIAMWHRGILTRDGVVQGLRESRLKNKYIEPLLALSETLPPERTIVSLVSKSAITPDRGMQLLLERGYAPDIAQALLAEAHKTKTQATRDLTQAQVVALYEDRAIDAATTHDMLASLGYDDSEIGWLTTLADLRRLKKFNDAAISRVHTQYVGHKVDATQVATTLDALGIAPDQRNDLLALWDIERTVTTKQLTLAQVEAAFKHQVIDAQTAFDRLQTIGYAADDAAILMGTLGVDPTTLTVGQ